MAAGVESESSINAAELLALKRRRLQLLRAKNDLIKSQGIHFYRPHEGQDAFHRAGLRVKKRYVRTGNRWGKSTCGCAEDIAWLLNERVWYPIGDPARRGGIPQHPVKLLTTGADWDKIAEVWTNEQDGKVWKMMPSGFVTRKHRNSVGCIDQIHCANGSSWRFESVKGFKYDKQSAESADWDAIHYDEPLPQKMRKALARGLMDRGGHEWFTLTPLTEFWINDFFFPAEVGEGVQRTRADVWVTTGTTYDNTYLSPENIKDYEDTLNDDEKQCRIQGIPLELAGLVYKGFKWSQHVLPEPLPGWAAFNIPPPDWTVYYAIDPHPRTPHAVLFCAVSPTGLHVYFQDIFKATDVPGLVKEIQQALSPNVLNIDGPRLNHYKHQWRVGRTIMDPLGFIEEPSTKTTMATELEKYGIVADKATKALDHGILRVQGQLKAKQILFTPNCARTLWEIQRYCWDAENERPLDENDHMMENLYRLELSDMRWIDPAWSNVSIPDIEIVRPELDLESVSFSD